MLRHTLRNNKWQYKEHFFVLTAENLFFFETEEEWNLKAEAGYRPLISRNVPAFGGSCIAFDAVGPGGL